MGILLLELPLEFTTNKYMYMYNIHETYKFFRPKKNMRVVKICDNDNNV